MPGPAPIPTDRELGTLQRLTAQFLASVSTVTPAVPGQVDMLRGLVTTLPLVVTRLSPTDRQDLISLRARIEGSYNPNPAPT